MDYQNDRDFVPNSPAIGDFSSVGSGSPWIGRRGSNSSYQFNFDESSWIFAREKCLAQNADLVSISDQAEMDFVLSRYPISVRLRDRLVLVGLSKAPGSGWGRWLDGSAVDVAVTPWRFGEPAEGGWASCAYLSVNGRILQRLSCDVRSLPILLTRYVCERSPEEEAHVLEADAAEDPAQLYLFLRKLGKLTELERGGKSDQELFGKGEEPIDLEVDINNKWANDDGCNCKH